MDTRRNNQVIQKPLLIFIIGFLLACSLCGLSLFVLNANSTASPMATLDTEVCIGLSTTPKWQIGLSWMSPISSYMPPLAVSPYAVCINIPSTWIATFTSKFAGEWMFPS